ncbi:hypothetical protein VTK73DRAFT_8620 [Phialemonium thermophilum]|uniref:BRCT domain-containing protein n=1 Tax=Phialemonium thermophilum TaxID=223376 RepID=A0ABR3W7R0_9PEZI
MARKATEKPIFRGLVIALACPLDGQWSETNIARWVALRSGVFSSEMTDAVTHLICTVKAFKDRVPRVKKALIGGDKTRCHVVTVDWLEDSCHKGRRMPEKPYLLTASIKEERAKRLQKERRARAMKLAEKFVNTNFYHVYSDSTHFRYEVTLIKNNEEEEIHGRRYILHLFESNAKPHLYWFAAKFYKKHRDSQPLFYRPSETPQLFDTEFARFKTFFQKKTGIQWDERLIKAGTMDQTYFVYHPPTGGIGRTQSDLIDWKELPSLERGESVS